MKRITGIFIFILATNIIINCSNNDGSNHRSLLVSLISSSLPPEVVLPNAPNMDNSSTIEVYNLPGEYANQNVAISESTISLPSIINYHYKPIGKIYNIEVVGHEGGIDFGSEFATLHYTYDKEALRNAGLIEDFMVYYFDISSNAWKPVEKVEVDKINSQVTAYTSHLTPFVITALSDPWVVVGNKITYNQTGESTQPSMAFEEGKPYIAFAELDKESFNYKIYVKKWDSQIKKWISIGSSLNNNANSNAHKPSIVINQQTPYVVFIEDTGGVNCVFVKKWNGNGWDTVGSMLNVGENFSADNPKIVFCNDKPIVSWTEIGNFASQLYVKCFDGISWNQLGGILNTNQSWSAKCPSMAISDNNIYLAWIEQYGGISDCYVSHWNGNVWVRDGDALNVEKNSSTWLPSIVSTNGRIFVSFEETSKISSIKNIYVKQLANGSWSLIGGRINISPTINVYYPTITTLNGKPYVAWVEYVDYVFNIYVSHWDGTRWIGDGQSLNINIADHTWYPFIGTNGVTFLVAFQQVDKGLTGVFVKAGNWNETVNDDPTWPMITKFNSLSLMPTKSNQISVDLDGRDNNGIVSWLITGSGQKPSYSDPNWQIGKPTDVTIDDFSSCFYKLYAWAKDADGNVSNPYYPIEIEMENPVPGNNALITHTGLNLKWSKAIDNTTYQEQLKYRVFYSVSNNIGCVETIVNIGTPVSDWIVDANTINVSSLSLNLNETYYFNVLVMDKVGNQSVYKTCALTVQPCDKDKTPPVITPPSDGEWVGPWVVAPFTPGGSCDLYLTVTDDNGISSVSDAFYQGNNIWKISISGAVPDGPNSQVITATDSCGNTSSIVLSYDKRTDFVCKQFCAVWAVISYQFAR